jgi:hypothetical protein
MQCQTCNKEMRLQEWTSKNDGKPKKAWFCSKNSRENPNACSQKPIYVNEPQAASQSPSGPSTGLLMQKLERTNELLEAILVEMKRNGTNVPF